MVTILFSSFPLCFYKKGRWRRVFSSLHFSPLFCAMGGVNDFSSSFSLHFNMGRPIEKFIFFSREIFYSRVLDGSPTLRQSVLSPLPFLEPVTKGERIMLNGDYFSSILGIWREVSFLVNAVFFFFFSRFPAWLRKIKGLVSRVW